MNNTRVFAHYEKINNIGYRWRTLLQLGNSWNILGTVIMKNPGSSGPLKYNGEEAIPIKESDLLTQLKKFDDTKNDENKEWYFFSVDNTMRHVVHLIGDYLDSHGKRKEGIIQIFNLFNVIDPSLDNALIIERNNRNIKNTFEDDLKHLLPPVYIGWGNLWKNDMFKDHAIKIFDAIKNNSHYLDTRDIRNNKFYHPQFLFGRGIHQPRCKMDYHAFIGKNLDIDNAEDKNSMILYANKEQIMLDKILNSMIEDSFKRYVRKDKRDNEWYRISSNFIVKVTSAGGGYVSIRDSKFDNKNNYSKRTINNQDTIIKHLEVKGYELKNDGARITSLGHKPFRKYAEWEQGPQYVVLSILNEIDELGYELEDIYNKKEL